MQKDAIEEGFEVFVSDRDKPFGAVRRVSSEGRAEILVYVENAGDFVIALAAVAAVHAQKVILDPDKLDRRLRAAIGHAHDAEDPRI